jgi:hypothetical protein
MISEIHLNIQQLMNNSNEFLKFFKIFRNIGNIDISLILEQRRDFIQTLVNFQNISTLISSTP